MADFASLRGFLEERRADLAGKADDPNQFQADFDRLLLDWGRLENERILEEATMRTMRKYPAVWQELIAAGLVAGEVSHTVGGQPSRQPAPPAVPVGSGHNTTRRDLQEPPAPHARRPDQSADEAARADGGPPAPPPGPQPSPTVADRLALLDKHTMIGKEALAGCIAIAIVLVTLLVAVVAVFAVASPTMLAVAKDILLILNGLVGVVLGYYFGRVPADARTEKAEGEARNARQERDQAVEAVRGILDDGAALDRSAGAFGLTLSPQQVTRLREVLRRHDR